MSAGPPRTDHFVAGPEMEFGRRRARLRRLGLVTGWVSLALAVLVAGVGFAAVQRVEGNITRVDVPMLSDGADGEPLNILVVGSDSREGLTRQEMGELTLGTSADQIDGQRSDTVLLVQVLPGDQGVNVVSFPRDLAVVFGGERLKLTEAFFGGPDQLVDVVQQNFGIPINHYVEVSVLGFVRTVEALGSVEICLDEPLRDRKSGADLSAGCQDLDPRQALAFVRSRSGARGDFERIARQQEFLKATLRELVQAELFLDVPRLLAVVEQVASNVTTDQGLGIGRMQGLAQRLAGVVAEGLPPMVVVPSYVQDLDGRSFVVPYRPGAQALFDAIEAGEPLADRGSAEDRPNVDVRIWTGGRGLATDLVSSTLFWSGFKPKGFTTGAVDAEGTTTVFFLPGQEREAGWVAATLGAPMRAMPASIEVPPGTQVVVAVGDDAAA